MMENRRLSTNILSMLGIAVISLSISGCRHDDIVFPPTDIPVTPSEPAEYSGFYLLNEGNMGSNKCSLDFFDFASGTYTRNIFGAANPDVPKELGDVGNDLHVYGDRLYAVINCSNKIEVMHAANAKRIGQIDIPNCRFIAFDGPYAYVTSYAGPVKIDPEYTQIGYVAKVDTATLSVVDTVNVGFQPDQLAIAGGKIYVANSGGYMSPNYENTISVIDIGSFKEERRVPVAINLSLVTADARGRIWTASRGDYFNTKPGLYCYDPESDKVVAKLDIAASSMWLDGDDLYVVSTAWSYESMRNVTANYVVDTASMSIKMENFITDGTESKIKVPYGVAVNPTTKEIYVTDAGSYVNPGYLYCFSPEGTLQWRVRTGDIPSSIAFLPKKR